MRRGKQGGLWVLRAQGALTPLLAAALGFAAVLVVVALDFGQLLWRSRGPSRPAEAAALAGPALLGQAVAQPLLQHRGGQAAKDLPAGRFFRQAGFPSPFRAASRPGSPRSASGRACRVSQTARGGD